VEVFEDEAAARRKARKEQSGGEAAFWNLYNVKLHTITLRELLLFQSLYVTRTLSDMVKIVRSQPQPTVFYKSFLELNGSNMTSVLSFDSRSLDYLLSSKFESNFSSEYPMFYKSKYYKGKGAN